MTLQTSGAISLANIQTEFGGTAPTSLSEYYAGGAYVPSGTTGTNGAVPSSGAISFSQFYGTSAAVAVTINFTDQTVSHTTTGSAEAAYRLTPTGAARQGIAGTFTTLEQGIAPPTSGYEVYVTQSGTLTSGPIGSWVSGTNTWATTRATGGVSSCTLTFQMRKVGEATILDTWTVILQAEVEF